MASRRGELAGSAKQGGTTMANFGPEFIVDTTTANAQGAPVITALDGGGYVVTWHSYDGVDDTSGYGIRARIFNSSGNAVGNDFLLNSTTASNQFYPAITALSGGASLPRGIPMTGSTIRTVTASAPASSIPPARPRATTSSSTRRRRAIRPFRPSRPSPTAVLSPHGNPLTPATDPGLASAPACSMRAAPPPPMTSSSTRPH